MRCGVSAVVMCILVASASAGAQSFMPLPNQLSVGVGLVANRQPTQTTPALNFSFAFADSGSDYWPYRLGLVWEGGIGPTSNVEPCQVLVDASDDPPNCDDAAFLMGVRFHFLRRQARRVMPFVHLLLGSYWNGSGVEDSAFDSGHFTLQGGGGVDLRRAGSVHGLRLSLDYRRIFSTDARNQFAFVTSYVLGPP